MALAKEHGKYAPVNRLRIYYEIHGASRHKTPPLVLLHGGGSAIETSFGRILPDLARTRQVIAFEQQGHGRTADVDRPFTFEQSAEDTAALLKYLKVERADFFGYSNGWSVALLMGIRHHGRVRKLVIESAMFKRDGLPPGFMDSMQRATLDGMPQELKDAYRKLVQSLLPHGQLAVLPGTDHMSIVRRADWVVSMVEAFLGAPMPQTR